VHHPVLVVALAAALAPIAAHHTRGLRIPVVVFELLLGVLVGPQVLNWVEIEGPLPYLAEMGTAFLFFMAGLEIDMSALRGPPLRLATLGWLCSLGIGAAIALALGPAVGNASWVLVAVALSTTALGIVVPVLRDAELLDTELGKLAIACGTIGELGPILLLGLLLAKEHGVGAQLGLEALFGIVIVGVMWASLSLRPPGLIQILRRTMTKSGQLPIRLSLLLIAVLVVLAEILELDLALGAFAAGMAVGLALRDTHNEVLHHKFDAIGFGFLIPIFFVVSGVGLDVRALLASPKNLLLVFVYAAALVLVRGLPALLFRRLLRGKELAGLGLYSATSLSLIVALTNAAVSREMMGRPAATALVGGGLISVLAFPVVATRLVGKSARLRENRREQVGY
jgi:Kef-type K+ transport system membrane component KefB